MRKALFIPLALFFPFFSFSQYIHKIKADSVLITNDSCNAELNLENSTRHVKGFLFNKGNGRTEFRKGLINYGDSIYVIGDDTLNFLSSASVHNGIRYNSTLRKLEFGNDTTDYYNGLANQVRPTIYNQNGHFFNWITGNLGVLNVSKKKYGTYSTETYLPSKYDIARFVHDTIGGIVLENNFKYSTVYAAPSMWINFKNTHPDAAKMYANGDSLVGFMSLTSRTGIDNKVYSAFVFRTASDTSWADSDPTVLKLFPAFYPAGYTSPIRLPTANARRLVIAKGVPGQGINLPQLSSDNPFSRLVVDAYDIPLVFANLPSGNGYTLVVDSTGKVWKNGSSYATTNWATTGNSGTNPSTNFLGTTDDNNVVLKRNGIEAFSLKKIDSNKPNVLSFPLSNTFGNSPSYTGNVVDMQAGTYVGHPTFELSVDSSSIRHMTFDIYGTRDHLFQFTPYTNRRQGSFAVIENYGYDGLRLSSVTNLTLPRPIYFDIGRVQKMKLDSLGNLAIGTNSPSAKLHVAGTGIFTDTLTATTMGTSDNSNRVATTAFVKSNVIDLATQVSGVLPAANGGVNYTVQSLTDGSTITWNVANGINAVVTLGGTGRTLSITNPVAGQTYTIRIIQDGTGSRTITTWPTNSKWPNGTTPTLSTVANRYDLVVFYYDGTNYYGTYQQNFQ